VPPAVFERFQLIVEIAGRFAGEAREIYVLRSLALRTMTRSACKSSRRHGVGRLLGYLGKRELARRSDTEKYCR